MLEINTRRKFQAVVIGASAGGGEAIKFLLSGLSPDYRLPILIAQHLHPSDDGMFAQGLAHKTSIKVNVPCDKDRIKAGEIYVSPSNYHMLIEREGSIALSIEEKVNYSRPSIDVLFESAAYAWRDEVAAVLLTGSSNDGAQGLRVIRDSGGLTVAQDPSTAEYPVMPRAAINAGAAELVLELSEIAALLIEIEAQGRL